MKAQTRVFMSILLTLLLSTLYVSSVPAQTSEPPEIQTNGELSPNTDLLQQAIDERRLSTVIAGDNDLNAAASWWSTSGAVFMPNASYILFTSVSYPGCLDTETDDDVWRAPVNLPHGATITGMYFNYANEFGEALGSTIYLRRYKYNGEFNNILSVTATTNGKGYHTQWTETVANNVVNNMEYNYVLVWMSDRDQHLCGVNLRYTAPPIFLQALPIIEK